MYFKELNKEISKELLSYVLGREVYGFFSSSSNNSVSHSNGG